MSDKFICTECSQERGTFWNEPPICNRCLLVAIVENAIWTALEKQAEEDLFGLCVGRPSSSSRGLVNGSDIDMTAVASAVLDEFDYAYERGHDGDIRDYLTQTGWR